jgi:hypothetical protein
VASTVRLLEQSYVALEKKGVDPAQLQKVKASLDHMERKLEVLNKAKETAEGPRWDWVTSQEVFWVVIIVDVPASNFCLVLSN